MIWKWFLLFVCVASHQIVDTEQSGRLGKAMVMSISADDDKTVVELIKMGADVNFVDSFGWTPLLWAANYNHPEIVQILLKHGSFVDSADERGRRALVMASANGHKEVVRVLLEHGAAIRGDAVIRAVLNEHKEVLQLLWQHSKGWLQQVEYLASYYVVTLMGRFIKSAHPATNSNPLENKQCSNPP
jgi:ankyrin repeat protein